MNYTEANNILTGKNHLSKKYANNTYLIRSNKHIALKYRDTEVVKFFPNGDITLDNGGWYTYTTKERINWMLTQLTWGIIQENGVWYLHSFGNTSFYRFQPGITIHSDGTITGYGKDNPKADKKLKAKVKKYAELCAKNVPLPPPNNGDCWDCAMSTEDGQSLGDVTHSNHLDLHMEESYIVPSLVFRALREHGNTDFILSLVFNNPDLVMLDIAKQRVKKSVYRYILRRKGYAV